MLFSLSFCVLSFEIALTRIFAYVFPYHFTPIAVSLAMLGLGLGASACAAFPRAAASPSLKPRGLSALSACFLVFYGALTMPWHPALVLAAALVPFLILGALASRFYQEAAADAMHRVYFSDLAGGAAGCLLAVPLLNALEPVGVALLLGAACGLLSLRARRSAASAAAALLAGAAFAGWTAGLLPDPWKEPKRLDKPLYDSLAREPGRIADHAWGEAGRADLYETPSFPGVKWIFNDATNSTMMIAAPDSPQRAAFLRRLSPALAFAALKPARALLIGPGAGLEAHLAALAGTRETDAVELNPAVPILVRRWRAFTGAPYDSGAVRLSVEEGRQFLIARREPYDLIQLALAFTATAQAGSFALAENYLYTSEAFRLYLSRLTPRGLLFLLDDSPQRSLREAATAAAVLEESGLSPREAMRRIAVVRNPGKDGTGYAYLVFVSPSALGADLRSRLAALCVQDGFVPVWLEGVAAREPFAALAAAPPPDDAAHRPPTDDRPFFFYFGAGPADLWSAVGAMIGVGLAALALAAACARALRPRPAPGAARGAFLAASCGTAFLLMESALLQVLALAARGPAQVVSVLLFSLLFWCAAAALAAGRARAAPPLRLCFALAAAACVYASFLNGAGLAAVLPRSSARAAALFLLLAPLGAAGLPFPTLLRESAAREPRATAALWAVNGFASVAGAAFAIALAFAVGIRGVLFAAAALYALAAAVAAPFPKSRAG